MPAQIEIGGIVLDVVLRDIKNVHLSVYPPNGKVRISAPLRMNFETISLFAISKLGWIRQQQKKLWAQERESQREYLDRESHYVWGRRYLLKVIEEAGAPSVQLHQTKLLLPLVIWPRKWRDPTSAAAWTSGAIFTRRRSRCSNTVRKFIPWPRPRTISFRPSRGLCINPRAASEPNAPTSAKGFAS